MFFAEWLATFHHPAAQATVFRDRTTAQLSPCGLPEERHDDSASALTRAGRQTLTNGQTAADGVLYLWISATSCKHLTQPVALIMMKSVDAKRNSGRPTSWAPKLNGSHFDLPPSSICIAHGHAISKIGI